MAKRRGPAAPPVRKSFLVIGGVALGCALLGFVVMNFLAGGGGDAVDDSAVLSTSNAPLASPGALAPGSDGAAAASPSATPANQLVPGGRDPFDPGSLAATPAPVQVVPVAPAPVQPQPTQVPVPQAALRTNPADPVVIGMKSVSADAADVWIDDTEHSDVRRGEELDGRFAVERIDTPSRCAILRDAAAPSGSQSFTLCENQTVRR
jgi:hypothetical protein